MIRLKFSLDEIKNRQKDVYFYKSYLSYRKYGLFYEKNGIATWSFAFSRDSKIMQDIISLMQDFSKIEEYNKANKKDCIDILCLETRISNALKRNNVFTIEDLLNSSIAEIQSIYRINKSGIRNIKFWLAKAGYGNCLK